MVKRRIIYYIFGLLLVTVGVSCFIRSNKGIMAIDAMGLSIHKLTGFTVGTSFIVANVGIILISVAISFRPEYFLSVILSIVFGFVLDTVLYLFSFVPNGDIVKIVQIIIGVLFVPVGGAFMVTSGLPSFSGDIFLKAIENKFHTPVKVSKFVAEASYLLGAIILGLIAGNLKETISWLTIVIFVASSIIFPRMIKFLNGGYKKNEQIH